MRLPVLPLLLVGVAILLSACAEEETFPYCEFDPCLWQQCSEDPGGAEGTRVAYSCAVVRHPQCPSDVCLRFEGSSPFCTQSCDPALQGSDCPEGARCLQYLGPRSDDEPATYYCIPTEADLTFPPAETGGTDACVPR
jgi:hypothetical protein